MPPTDQKSNSRYRRPDTYRAAARLIGVSVPHVYEILHGNRSTTPAKAETLRRWAEEQSVQAGSKAPAVIAAVSNLSN